MNSTKGHFSRSLIIHLALKMCDMNPTHRNGCHFTSLNRISNSMVVPVGGLMGAGMRVGVRGCGVEVELYVMRFS